MTLTQGDAGGSDLPESGTAMTQPLDPNATAAAPAAASPAAPPSSAPGAFSPDGAWYWDGAAWVPTLTPDARWRWDGRAWQLVRPIDTANPDAAQADLTATADDLFAQAGVVASQRRMEWPVPQDLYPVLQALDAAQVQLQAARKDRDRAAISAQVRAIAADLGRRITTGAPADVQALLDTARAQIAAANILATAQAALAKAQTDFETHQREAQARAQAAEAARNEAIAPKQAALQQAEQAHAAALEAARQKVRSLRAPGPGAEVGRFGGVVLYENQIETPDGRGATSGARASVLTVEELFAKHRHLVDVLAALGGPSGELVADADWRRPGESLLLVETPTVVSVVPAAAEHLDAVRAFAERFADAAARAEAAAPARTAALAEAEKELRSVAADTAAGEAARAELERVEGDAALQRAISEARSEAELAAADTGPVEAARARLAEAAAAALTAPAPLNR